MAGAIGAEVFQIVPEPDKGTEQVEILDRAGLSGVAARLDGFRGREFTIIAETDLTLANPAAINAKATVYGALAGTIVAVTADNGRTFPAILIRSVESRFKKILAGVGGSFGASASHWASVRFECIDTSIV